MNPQIKIFMLSIVLLKTLELNEFLTKISGKWTPIL
jgi:hypothetical protein